MSHLKEKTAGTLKWNAIDRIASQLVYAVVGIVLANILSKEDFGLVGALLVFQAFATIFVDSGFGAALLQKKNPTQKDFSTVFWFNLVVSLLVYLILFLLLPYLARLFQNDLRLVPLGRIMFLAIVINGLANVQTNRLMKRMEVKNVAVGNTLGLCISGTVGITLAVHNAGAWALVWQTLVLAAVKTAWLWITSKWQPSFIFSRKSLKSILPVGSSVLGSAFLNTLCLNIYSFIIGAYFNLKQLGVYTQADKWSKMGSASISQILTSTFVPLLSGVQDSIADFHRYISRINRLTAFMTFPALAGLALIGEPLFHLLFGNKWDEAIPLFQILSVRGIFVVLISLAGNYMLSIGKSKLIIWNEIVKDLLIAIAILATVFQKNITILVWGQFFASFLTFIILQIMIRKGIGYKIKEMVKDFAPYLILTMIMSALAYLPLYFKMTPGLIVVTQLAVGASVYLGLSRLLKLKELTELINFIFKKK